MSRRSSQVPVWKASSDITYDSTFDAVSGEGSSSVDLSDYLIWATAYQPASAGNATLLAQWMGYFHMFDANNDGKIDFDEMHRPASKSAKSEM
ncbi:hypothetical protein Q7P37_002932 [Cladosporium fusiforme]